MEERKSAVPEKTIRETERAAVSVSDAWETERVAEAIAIADAAARSPKPANPQIPMRKDALYRQALERVRAGVGAREVDGK